MLESNQMFGKSSGDAPDFKYDSSSESTYLSRKDVSFDNVKNYWMKLLHNDLKLKLLIYK